MGGSFAVRQRGSEKVRRHNSRAHSSALCDRAGWNHSISCGNSRRHLRRRRPDHREIHGGRSAGPGKRASEPVANAGEHRGRAQRFAHAGTGLDSREHSRRPGRPGYYAGLRSGLLQNPRAHRKSRVDHQSHFARRRVNDVPFRPHAARYRWYYPDHWSFG